MITNFAKGSLSHDLAHSADLLLDLFVHVFTYTHTHTHIYIYIYIYI
jgi:hypothetical protein